MNGSDGVATSGSIVLGAMAEKKNPSYATIHCPNRLISPLPTWEGEKGRFRRILPVETVMTERSVGSATVGLIVLDALPQKKDPSMDSFFSSLCRNRRSQSV